MKVFQGNFSCISWIYAFPKKITCVCGDPLSLSLSPLLSGKVIMSLFFLLTINITYSIFLLFVLKLYVQILILVVYHSAGWEVIFQILSRARVPAVEMLAVGWCVHGNRAHLQPWLEELWCALSSVTLLRIPGQGYLESGGNICCHQSQWWWGERPSAVRSFLLSAQSCELLLQSDGSAQVFSSCFTGCHPAQVQRGRFLSLLICTKKLPSWKVLLIT